MVPKKKTTNNIFYRDVSTKRLCHVLETSFGASFFVFVRAYACGIRLALRPAIAMRNTPAVTILRFFLSIPCVFAHTQTNEKAPTDERTQGVNHRRLRNMQSVFDIFS